MEQLTARARAVRLLEQAVAYNLAAVAEVGPAALHRPTPCAAWDLERLLLHLRESLTALREAADLGRVALLPPEEAPPPDPGGLAGAVREDAEALLDGWRRWARAPHDSAGCVRVAGMHLPGGAAAFVGAVELAVHGWDIAQACGRPRPIPAPLALALLRRAPLVADPSTRPALFAPPLPAPPHASPSTRLLTYLGRNA